MTEVAQITFTLTPSDAARLASSLNALNIEPRTRKIRAFDGGAELASIAVAAATHAAKKLVDGIAALIGSLIHSTPSEPPIGGEQVVSPVLDIEIRRGDMILTLKNAPLAEVERLLALIGRESADGASQAHS